MKVKFKKLDERAIAPTRAHDDDAGFDMYAISLDIDKDGNYVYKTGIAMEIPKGYVGLLFPRSSVAKKDQIQTNCVGVIDSNYRGDITVKMKPLYGVKAHNFLSSNIAQLYDAGDRVAQLIIIQYPYVDLEESDELSETDRGAGGYGSTGR